MAHRRKYRRGLYPLVHPGRSRVRKPKVQSYQFRAVNTKSSFPGGVSPWDLVYIKVRARYADEAVEKALKIARRKLKTRKVRLTLLGIR